MRDRDRQAGHGTFVAGVLLRHAPGVTIRHHRSLSSLGLTDDVTVATALRQVHRNAAARGERLDVVVLTAGCHTADDRCPPVLAREIARHRDTIVVASAGNNGTSRPFWPAALPSVIGVAATGADGELAPFSNHGDWVDAVAPGVDVVSSYVLLLPGEEGVAPGTTTQDLRRGTVERHVVRGTGGRGRRRHRAAPRVVTRTGTVGRRAATRSCHLLILVEPVGQFAHRTVRG